MTALRTRAIVLRRTNYGEADRIVQLITPEGRQSVIARGVRKEKSKLAGGIELFAVSDVVINRGKGELSILTSARLVHFYRHIMEGYDTLQFAYEVVRQVAKVTETVDEPEWFDLLQETLAGLDARLPRSLVETWFYLRHSLLLGRELNLTDDINSNPLDPTQRYTYDVGEQGLRPMPGGEITSDHIKLLRLIQVKNLEVLAQIGGIAPILPECWNVAHQHVALN